MIRHRFAHLILASQLTLGLVLACIVTQANEIDFQREVQPLLTKYCAGCHNQQEPESGFAADSFASISKGSENGAVINQDALADSKLIGLINGTIEPKMPPEGEPQPSDNERKIVIDWVLSGGKASESNATLMQRVEDISPTKSNAAQVVYSEVMSDGNMMLGFDGRAEVRSADQKDVLQSIGNIVGRVTSIRENAKGLIAIASGVAGLGGQVTLYDVAAKQIVAQFDAHSDVVYAATVDPTNSLLATAGYDREILLWSLQKDDASANLAVTQIGKLTGHNGAVYDLDFDVHGKLLCSASADETIKLWHVNKRERLDTFSQCEGEQYSCRFSADGNRIYAAGADRRVRVWKVINREQPEVNPMLHSIFAHEDAVAQIRFARDGKMLMSSGKDRTVKAWNSDTMAPMGLVDRLNGLPVAISVDASRGNMIVTTSDGKLVSMNVPDEAPASTVTPIDHSVPATARSTDSDAMPQDFADKGNNDHPDQAQDISLPCSVNGVIQLDTQDADQSDSDYYRFQANAGETWVFTIIARKDGSPLDSRIEILTVQGDPITRARLQAVRETYFTFRAKNSTQSDDYRLHRWEDMELNELIYANGEVNKLWLYPRGPDSGFLVYPGSGNRATYFDTTASTHALNEPAYIVRELQPNEAPAPNGLPVYSIYYENDDDADRSLDKDSQLYFTAPETGSYLIRVRDSRSLQGDAFKYRLEVRRPKPAFTIAATSGKPLHPGCGTEIEFTLTRLDNFTGPVQIQLNGLPEGFVVSQPLFIEAEQIKAVATVYAPIELTNLPEQLSISVKGIADIDGEALEVATDKPVEIKLSKDSIMRPRLIPSGGDSTSESLKELIIHPGETITANVVLEGGDNTGEYSFGTEDSNRNFPHGIIISNIGLNGLLIPADQNNRKFFITAAPWLQAQERPIHIRNKNGENETTQPVLLKVVPR
jgi:WD40 repeat protein